MKATAGSSATGKLLWSVSEVAQTLGISRSTVRRLVRRGQLPVVKIGDRPLFRPDDVEALLSRLREARPPVREVDDKPGAGCDAAGERS
jgi:excisionase family DNA binding protein